MKLLEKIWPWSQFETMQQRIDRDTSLIDKLERQCAKPSETSRKGWSTRRAKALMAAYALPFQPLRPRDEVVADVRTRRMKDWYGNLPDHEKEVVNDYVNAPPLKFTAPL